MGQKEGEENARIPLQDLISYGSRPENTALRFAPQTSGPSAMQMCMLMAMSEARYINEIDL